MFGNPFSSAVRNRSMNWADFIGTEFHNISPGEFGWNH
jgi:hypothetical protein